MSTTGDCLLAIVELIFIVYYLACWNLYFVADLLVQLTLFEVNRYNNSKLIQPHRKKANDGLKSLPSNSPADNYLACVIVYREEEALFERCLRSYKQRNGCCQAFVLGIDGNEPEDMRLVRSFQKVFADSSCNVLSFENTLGDRYTSNLNKYMDFSQKSSREVVSVAEHLALQETISFLTKILRPILHSLRSSESGCNQVPLAICFSQPHVGIKEIRFATWLISIALCKELGIDFVWSSDSDSEASHEAIKYATGFLKDCVQAGAASTALGISNRGESLMARLCAAQFRSHIYVDKACPAAQGQSTVVTGPSAAFRVEALEQVLIAWYQQRIYGFKTDINEDAHIATQLGIYGWQRLYVQTTLTYTSSKTQFLPWLKQQIRWKRSGHLEKIYSPLYNCKCGVVYLWWRIRELIVDSFIFLELIQYAVSGRFFSQNAIIKLSICNMVLAIYNNSKSPEETKDWKILPLSYLLQTSMMPFAHVWALFTVFQDSWGSTDRDLSLHRIVSPSHSAINAFGIAFSAWLIILAAVGYRFLVALLHALGIDG